MKKLLIVLLIVISNFNLHAQFYDNDDEIIIYENVDTKLTNDLNCSYNFLVFNFAGEKAKILNDIFDTPQNKGVIDEDYYKKEVNKIIRDYYYFEKRILEDDESYRTIISLYTANTDITAYNVSYLYDGIEPAWSGTTTVNYLFTTDRQQLTVVEKSKTIFGREWNFTTYFRRITKENFYNKLINWYGTGWRERTSSNSNGTIYE